MATIPMQTIKYAGSKANLLEFIIPEIKSFLGYKDLFIDLFSGTSNVSYALKDTNRILCNDVQNYSKTISNALIKNNRNLKENAVFDDILPNINEVSREYSLFTDTYSNTYFTRKQCGEIDGLCAAISLVRGRWKRDLYLVSLMHAMSYCASTTGHFAEYLNKKNKRSIIKRFIEKANSIKIVKGFEDNIVTCMDFKKLINSKRYRDLVGEARVIYADPPYSEAQYSRFYHLLETAVKYDYPDVEFKGKYRKDRFFSDFSRKSKVSDEFRTLFSLISSNLNGTLVMSYVNHGRGLLHEKDLIKIASEYFEKSNIRVKRKQNYKHSKLGNKGVVRDVEEFLLICNNS